MVRARHNLPKGNDRHIAHMLAALIDHNGDIAAAAKAYKDTCLRPYHKQVHRTLKTCWKKYQSGKIILSVRSTPTRRRKVSDAQAYAAAEAFIDVPQQHGLPVYYANERDVRGHQNFRSSHRFQICPSSTPTNSHTHAHLFGSNLILQACQKNTVLKNIIKLTGVTPAHLFRRAQEVMPNLKKKICHIKDIRSYAWVAKRLQMAKALFCMPEYYYKDAIMIDECKLHVFSPPKRTVIAPTGTYPYTLTRLSAVGAFPPSAQIKLHFILAIHRVYGVIHFQFLSPTKGERMHGRYQVSLFFAVKRRWLGLLLLLTGSPRVQGKWFAAFMLEVLLGFFQHLSPLAFAFVMQAGDVKILVKGFSVLLDVDC
jgi:hypothetical protein